jgi:hypothetical protein
MISQYWVGQIPERPMSVQINDSEGQALNLSGYTTFNFKMLDSNNAEVDLSGGQVVLTQLFDGKLSYVWPTTKSLFQYPGDYIVQIELTGTGKKDYTNTHTIRVRELGKRFR